MKSYSLPLVSLGSPYGVGYEIFLRSVKKIRFYNNINIPVVCIGSKSTLLFFIKLLKFKKKFLFSTLDNIDNIYNLSKNSDFDFVLIDIDDKFTVNNFEDLKEVDGYYAYKTINVAADILKNGYFKALVTLPVNKNSIHEIANDFLGHTEFFQKKWGEKSVYMTFVSKKMLVMLLTTHIPLIKVSEVINFNNIYNILKASLDLKKKLNLKKGICFLGFNPHAGENGIIGKEDLIIKEAIDKFNSEHNTNIIGPIPSDTAFIPSIREKFSIFISCYHDQGLIPFKMLYFKEGVNFSYGMNIIRTSVDHGTAIPLIGKKKADIKSFINAYKLALKLS